MPLDELWPRLEFRPLEVEPQPGLPRDYVAVKAYFNECLPADEPEPRVPAADARDARRATSTSCCSRPACVVDDHEEWAASHERVHPIEHLLRPEDNLAVQTRIVAGARGLVATYGGFSYLGPLLGVPTLGFLEIGQTMPIHLEVIRRAVPGADYEQVKAGDDAAVSAFVSRVRAAAGS